MLPDSLTIELRPTCGCSLYELIGFSPSVVDNFTPILEIHTFAKVTSGRSKTLKIKELKSNQGGEERKGNEGEIGNRKELEVKRDEKGKRDEEVKRDEEGKRDEEEKLEGVNRLAHMVSVIVEDERGGYNMWSRGDVDLVMAHCSTVLHENSIETLSTSLKRKIERKKRRYDAASPSCIAFAFKPLPHFTPHSLVRGKEGGELVEGELIEGELIEGELREGELREGELAIQLDIYNKTIQDNFSLPSSLPPPLQYSPGAPESHLPSHSLPSISSQKGKKVTFESQVESPNTKIDFNFTQNNSNTQNINNNSIQLSHSPSSRPSFHLNNETPKFNFGSTEDNNESKNKNTFLNDEFHSMKLKISETLDTNNQEASPRISFDDIKRSSFFSDVSSLNPKSKILVKSTNTPISKDNKEGNKSKEGNRSNKALGWKNPFKLKKQKSSQERQSQEKQNQHPFNSSLPTLNSTTIEFKQKDEKGNEEEKKRERRRKKTDLKSSLKEGKVLKRKKIKWKLFWERM